MENDFIQQTELQGVYVIARPVFNDERGFFHEVFRKKELEQHLGFVLDFVQINHSRSKKGTLRGIHRAPWHKLVTVASGQVQQVVVDLREDSKSFGQYFSILLDPSKAVFVPAFCGNAFLALSEEVNYLYNVTDYWTAGAEKSVIYSDPDIGVKWELGDVNLSEKDSQNPRARELFPEKFK